MDNTNLKLAILYADVSGSTRLYEEFGDDIARTDIHTCIELLTKVVKEQQGEVVKTIGDEVMCRFSDPLNAAVAAKEMHESLRDASDMDEFQSGELHIKIGWHYGAIYWRGKEILGEAPVTAQQVIRLAKRDETLTTQQSLQAIPDELKGNSHLIVKEKAEAWEGEVEIYMLPWDEEDDSTQMGGAYVPKDISQQTKIIITYQTQEYEVAPAQTPLTIGRGKDNKLTINGRFTSRHHAEIDYRHGRFHLLDMSINGSVLVNANGKLTRLHREDIMLASEGTIYFSGTPDEDSNAKVTFRCYSE